MLSDFLFSANVIVPIFLLILLGYVLTRLRLWDEHFLKIANDVCFTTWQVPISSTCSTGS